MRLKYHNDYSINLKKNPIQPNKIQLLLFRIFNVAKIIPRKIFINQIKNFKNVIYTIKHRLVHLSPQDL